MKKSKSTSYILALMLTALLFLFGTEPVRAQEVEDEREFDYANGGKKGPTRWGELKKEWAACKYGKLQSPIDMSNERVKVIRTPEKKNYKPANATLRNRGHDITLRWDGDAGSVVINGTKYSLAQAHWHSPSEHTINGRRYNMELHLVHQTLDRKVTNKIAVIGIFYQIKGEPDKFLSKLTENISAMIDKNEDRKLGMIDPNDIKMASQRYYRYLGSLTVPPCTEGVIWTLSTKVRTVSRGQVKLLREAVHDYAEANARPLQEQNGRAVYLYGPGNI